MPWFGTSKVWLVGAWLIVTSEFLDEESVTLLWSLFVWRVLPPVQKANIAAEELFWPSEFHRCLTDFMCLVSTAFPIFPNSKVDWHTLHLKLCLLAGSSNSHEWNMVSSYIKINEYVSFLTDL